MNLIKKSLRKDRVTFFDKPKLLNYLYFALTVVFTILIGFQLWHIQIETFDIDFAQFEYAIKTLLSGGKVYQFDSAAGIGIFYPYPLWTSFLYLPIAWLEHTAALHTWTILNCIILVPVVWWLKNLYLPGLGFFYLLPLYFLSLLIASIGLLDGFPLIIILAAFTLMLKNFQAERFFQSGVWGALGLLIKPHVTVVVGLVFILWLFFDLRSARQTLLRWWAGAVTGTLVLLGVSLAIDIDWIPRFLNMLRVDNMTGGRNSAGYVYEWVTSTFPGWLSLLTGWSEGTINLLYVLFALVIITLGIYRLISFKETPLNWLALAIVLNFTLTPYARAYDFALLVIPIFCLLSVIRNAITQKNYYLVTLNISGLILIYLIPVFSKDYRWYYFQPLIICLLMLLQPKRGGFSQKSSSDYIISKT